MIYVKIGGTEYPAVINGKIHDNDWDERESKTIILEMSYTDAVETFVDGCSWSIVCTDEEEGGDYREEFDNSDFNISGDITDHRDGTVSIKMGKMTDLEEAYEMMYGGE